MKKIVLLFVVAFSSTVLMAQKFAYVDTDYILKQIPAYESAQDQLDALSVEWQKEIEALYAEIDKMYKDYQAEKVLLTEDLKIKKEEEIISSSVKLANLLCIINSIYQLR